MIPKRKRAARLGQQAASKTESHKETYPKDTSMSSLKLAIGELLLFGNRQQKEFWPLFEALLVQSYANVPQTHRHGRDMAVEWTIS